MNPQPEQKGRNMNSERRDFLKTAGTTMVSGGLMIALFPALSGARGTGIENIYAYIVDTHKCIGCGKCAAACKAENHVPDHCHRTWVERYTVLNDGEVQVDSPDGAINGFPPVSAPPDRIDKSFFVPKLCNHCAHPNCVQVCPVGATYVSADGVVLVDPKQCVGCSYCVQACPYGARFINPVTGAADKCTWCYHRITEGLAPACVEVCPTGARAFGRIDDPSSSVAKSLKRNRLQVLKPETGNKPMVFYVGLDKEVR